MRILLLIALIKGVIKIGFIVLFLFLVPFNHRGKGQKVTRSMQFMIKFNGIVQFEGVLHAGTVVDSLEGIIPNIIVRDEEETGETVGEEHLTTLKVGGQESRWHATRFEGISVHIAPFNACLCESVSTESTGSRSDGTSHDAA